MDLSEVKSIIEAILFAADKPVSVEQFAMLLEVDYGTVEQLIHELQEE